MKVIKHKDKWYLQSDTGYKEILLSTDTELQKDGVQAIDDEFLEWFVNNQNCEYIPIIPPLFGRPYIIWIEKLMFKEELKKEISNQETLEDIKLEEVFGSNYGHLSVVENKLTILYRNQEQLLKAIKLLSNEK